MASTPVFPTVAALFVLVPALLAGCVTPPDGPAGGAEPDAKSHEAPIATRAVSNLTTSNPTPAIFAKHTLVERVFAAYNEDRGPGELRLQAQDDRTLWRDVRLGWANLTEADRDALRPFVVRPDDPQSVYAPDENPEQLSFSPCPGTWQARKQGAVKVWWDGCEPAMVSTVLATLASVWGPETSAMGFPADSTGAPTFRDNGNGGGPEIDFYIVRCIWCGPVRGAPTPMRADALAETRIDISAVLGFVQVSSFILLSGPALAKASSQKCAMDIVRQTTVHELFHALEDQYDRHQSPDWLREGMAQASEIRFLPASGADVHCRRFGEAQAHRGPLEVLDYAAYLWWRQAWTEDATGSLGDARILNVWKALRDGKSPTAAANAGFPFAGHFADYAFRNLNRPDIADVEPPVKWWKDTMPEFARTENPSAQSAEFGPTLDAPVDNAYGLRREPLGVPLGPEIEPLTVWYLDLKNVRFDGGRIVNQIRIDPTDLNLAPSLTLEVLWQSGDSTWHRDRITGRAVLCDPVEVHLVLANSGISPHTFAASGLLKIRPLSESCDCPDTSWVRTWKFDANSPEAVGLFYDIDAFVGENAHAGAKAIAASFADYASRYDPRYVPEWFIPHDPAIRHGRWQGAVDPASWLRDGERTSDSTHGGVSIGLYPDCRASIAITVTAGGLIHTDEGPIPWTEFAPFGGDSSDYSRPIPKGNPMERYAAVREAALNVEFHEPEGALPWSLRPLDTMPEF